MFVFLFRDQQEEVMQDCERNYRLNVNGEHPAEAVFPIGTIV